MPRVINLDKILKDLIPAMQDGATDEEVSRYFDQYTKVQQSAIFQGLRKLREKAGIGQQKASLPTNPADFAEKFSTEPWQHAPHLTMLSKKLAKGSGKGMRLMVSMPPRMGKSRLLSVWYPLWRMALNPAIKISIVGYGAEFASGWGKETRKQIIEIGSDIGLKLDQKQMSMSDWALTSGGRLRTTGVDGVLTGVDVDLMVIDDPIKDEKEAASETIRETVWNWWQGSALTRLMPHTDCVVVATRWHQDDLLGRLEQQSNNGEGILWDIVKIPAIAGDQDPLGREKGELLWPERFGRAYWDEKRRGTSTYLWSALYQQSPSPEGGGRIKDAWWQFYTPEQMPPTFDQMLQSWDLSLKVGKGRDPVAGQVWGRLGAKYYLIAEAHGELDLPAVIAQCKKWALLYPKATMKLIEDKAAGPALIQMLRHEAVGGVIPVNPTASKEARVEAILPLIEGGDVMLPKNSDGSLPKWVDALMDECRAFPQGKHDDRVDALTQALSRLMPGGWSTLSKAHGAANRANVAPMSYAESLKKGFWDQHREEVKAYESQEHGERMGAEDPYFGEW